MKKFKYFTTDGSTYKLLQRNAKSNRRYATEAESVLWECLRRNALGARFRRQHPVCGYIPDFVCLSRKLIIEVVENQMRDNNPPITDITFNRLLSEGYTKQQAKEKIAVIVTNHIYDTMKYKIPFNEERYTKDLSEIK